MKFTNTALMFLFSTTTARAFAPQAVKSSIRKGGMERIRPWIQYATAPYTDSAKDIAPDTIESDEFLSTYNAQVTNEMSASQLYLSASLWCERRELTGMAQYMRSESDEEREHAGKFLEFANKRNIPVHLQTLQAPPHSWDSVTHLWVHLLEAEQENTKALQKLGDVASQSGTVDAKLLDTFLDPFFIEQVNSEDELHKIVAKVRDVENEPGQQLRFCGWQCRNNSQKCCVAKLFCSDVERNDGADIMPAVYKTSQFRISDFLLHESAHSRSVPFFREWRKTVNLSVMEEKRNSDRESVIHCTDATRDGLKRDGRSSGMKLTLNLAPRKHYRVRRTNLDFDCKIVSNKPLFSSSICLLLLSNLLARQSRFVLPLFGIISISNRDT
eukprot:scaffold823_cov219-Amphora_coffeaeformis.AAC.12